MAVVVQKIQGTGNREQGTARQRVVRIGVLGLQGDFEKHLELLQAIDSATSSLVRTPRQVLECDGLIIPGGESTTVGKLMARYGIDEAIKARHAEGMAIFGTCTGMILLAKQIEDSGQNRLGLMDITVRRNAFGRQIDSFEVDLDVTCVGEDSIRAVFIRAPYVTDVRGDAQVLARLETGEIVMVRQGNCLAAAFHPEVTDDTRIHEYFVSMARPEALPRRNPLAHAVPVVSAHP